MRSTILRSVQTSGTSTLSSSWPLSLPCCRRRHLKTKARQFGTFPGQPSGPRIVTASVPGPASKDILKDLNNFGDFRTAVVALQYEKCKGNYVVDADGNTLLDMFGQIASMSVGYRNEALEGLAKSEDFAIAAMNRPALGVFPPTQWRDILASGLLKETVRPKGLTQIFTANCGSTANESAYKAAFMAYAHKRRGGHSDFTDAENESSMRNAEPGSPVMSILSFKTGFHGRLFGSLSTTRSKPIHKVDIPAFDWPAVDWPQLQYPLEQHKDANRVEEERCLKLVADTIDFAHKSPIAAIVVEPVQSEGGDNHATPHFFLRLREITRDRGVYMIVDEVQTGVGATGTFWAHEKWNLTSPPDAVTFSKKMQAAGYYHTEELRPSAGYRNFNTWMGDPARAMQAAEIIKYIDDNKLVQHTAEMGSKLFAVINEIASSFPNLVQNLRGKTEGTFLAFDTSTPAQRDALVAQMRQQGVMVGGSGARAVRLRPMLVFGDSELKVFSQALLASLKHVSAKA